jgi:hypothetical protein
MALTRTERSKAFRQRNKEKGLRADGKPFSPVPQRDVRLSRRDYNLRASYGITEAQYLEMYQQQQGRCAICGCEKDKLFVDHDHKTGKVRKLLCHQCNTGIGYLQDDWSLIRKAANYVLDCSMEHQVQDLLEKRF